MHQFFSFIQTLLNRLKYWINTFAKGSYVSEKNITLLNNDFLHYVNVKKCFYPILIPLLKIKVIKCVSFMRFWTSQEADVTAHVNIYPG